MDPTTSCGYNYGINDCTCMHIQGVPLPKGRRGSNGQGKGEGLHHLGHRWWSQWCQHDSGDWKEINTEWFHWYQLIQSCNNYKRRLLMLVLVSVAEKGCRLLWLLTMPLLRYMYLQVWVCLCSFWWLFPFPIPHYLSFGSWSSFSWCMEYGTTTVWLLLLSLPSTRTSAST